MSASSATSRGRRSSPFRPRIDPRHALRRAGRRTTARAPCLAGETIECCTPPTSSRTSPRSRFILHRRPGRDAGEGDRVRTPRRRPRCLPPRVRGGRAPLPAGAQASVDTTPNAATSCSSSGTLKREPATRRRRSGRSPRRRSSPKRCACPSDSARAALGYGSRMLWDVSRDDEYLRRCSSGQSKCWARGQRPPCAPPCPTRRRAAAGRRFDPARRMRSASRRSRWRAGSATPTLAYALAGYISAHHSPDHARKQVELAGELIERAARPASSSGRSRRTSIASSPARARRRSGRERRPRRDDRSRRASSPALTGLVRHRDPSAPGAAAGPPRGGGGADRGRPAARRAGAGVELGGLVWAPAVRPAALPGPAGGGVDTVRAPSSEYPTYRIWRAVLAQVTSELDSTKRATTSPRSRGTGSRSCRSTRPGSWRWVCWPRWRARSRTPRRRSHPAAAAAPLRRPSGGLDAGGQQRSGGAMPRSPGDDDGGLGRRRALLRGGIVLNRRIGARPWLAFTRATTQ